MCVYVYSTGVDREITLLWIAHPPCDDTPLRSSNVAREALASCCLDGFIDLPDAEWWSREKRG